MALTAKEVTFIHDILAGDEQALREFARAYSPKVFGFIRKKVGQDADAEEILQDTLLAGLEGLRDFGGRCTLSTYLCAIARHKVIDYYRRRKLKQIVFSQLPEEVLPVLSAFLGPEGAFDAHEVQERIALVFQKLRPRYRQILVLKYIEDRSVKEIAQELAITTKSAESTLFRARVAFATSYSRS